MKISLIIFIICLNFAGLNLTGQNSDAQAATNLIKGGDFEGDISFYWSVWSGGRTVEMFRSYETALGQGSYSLGLAAAGAPAERFSGGFAGNARNIFRIDTSKQYYLQFYAKASAPAAVSIYLQNTSNFTSASNIVEQSLTTAWSKYLVQFIPQASDTNNMLLAMALGDLPEGVTVNFDSLHLFDSNIKLVTTEVKGSIGDKNKTLRFNTSLPFSESDIEIELPYFDSQIGSVSSKKFRPSRIAGNLVYFDMHEATYSGVGNVYINSFFAGKFTYNAPVKVSEVYPGYVRAGEDITVEGAGFIPVENSTFLVVKVIDEKNKTYDHWAAPKFMDSKLKYAVFGLPVGLINSDLYIVTNFRDINGRDLQNKSTKLKYTVMPVIFRTEWSNRGYEQVGDNLKIYGRGIAQNPVVNFYNDSDVMVTSKKAKLISIIHGDVSEEVIQVDTLSNLNRLEVTVTANGLESDPAGSLAYSAKPRITSIVTKNSRPMAEGSGAGTVPAAKIGEEITLVGNSFYNNGTVYLELQRLGDRMQFAILSENVSSDGKQLKFILPEGAQTGFICLEVNGEKSNYLPMEIIPTVNAYWPNPVFPGEALVINANGVGNNINLTRVYFDLGNGQELEVMPEALEVYETNVSIRLTAPMALSSNYSSLAISYDRWRDDSKPIINVLPRIISASISPDDKILVIKGYGFSIQPSENLINFKNSDQTPASPNYRILGVYPTEEGQELRVQILDDNYFYGFVSVRVGDNISNEAGFGPVVVRKIARRVEYVRSVDRVMGVLYISGLNMGPRGGVRVGEVWADVHYRSDTFIIAVVEPDELNGNPVIVARE